MMSETEMNDGVQIILNRMQTNPEEFFGEGGRWNWIYKETLREVMTEVEKAALYEGLKKVRRAEITAKAAATVLRANEMDERDERDSGPFGRAQIKAEGMAVGYDLTTAQSNGTSAKLVPPKKRSLKDLL